LSKAASTLTLPGLTTDDALKLSRQVVADLGWKIEAEDAQGLVIKEYIEAYGVSMVNPVKIKLRVEGTTAAVIISLATSNFGFGPIQNRHVEGQTLAFRNRLRLAADASQPGEASIATELTRLAELRDAGALTAEEFAWAKRTVLDRHAHGD
jgi:hypothetical protein